MKNRMKEYRAKHNLTQSKLAKLAGLHPVTIRKLELDNHDPTLLAAWKIAKAFGVQIEDIFMIEEE